MPETLPLTWTTAACPRCDSPCTIFFVETAAMPVRKAVVTCDICAHAFHYYEDRSSLREAFTVSDGAWISIDDLDTIEDYFDMREVFRRTSPDPRAVTLFHVAILVLLFTAVVLAHSMLTP